MPDFSALHYYEPQAAGEPSHTVDADLVIYGGTSAAIAAAVQARREGLAPVIAAFGRHLGGLTTGGLGGTDVGNGAAIGGLSRQFYCELNRRYGGDPEAPAWRHDPGTASAVYADWLEEHEIPVHRRQALAQVEKEGGRITELVTENGSRFRGALFLDCTYEGDLLARAGVSYTVGREANHVYRETLNGIHFGHPNHNFQVWIDPYRREGRPDSGLLPGISDEPLGYHGQGDRAVQAYNFRICLTRRDDIRVPLPEPPAYDPELYQLLLRYVRAGVWDAMRLHKEVPGGKTDLNNKGAVSTDFIGQNHAWPEASYAEREAIFQAHVSHNLGMLYFLANDPRVPAAIREEVAGWGLAGDAFTATGHWPPQLYVREARRMVGPMVMTEHHCRGIETVEDGVGLAAYGMDSHHCRRLAVDGRCFNEGNVEYKVPAPYPISYRALTPHGEECTNLLVPVCLSSSHIAYGSIRMEPVFMILGQSAATAAALALEDDLPVQEVPYPRVRERLLADGQVLNWSG